MLVLSRRTGEQVTILLGDGRTITVTVTRIGDGKTRLGFDAPRDVTILRSEMLPAYTAGEETSDDRPT